MGDEGDGLAGLHPDLLDEEVHLVAGEGVERAERLVHQQDRRVDGEAADDRGALLHAAGQFARILVVEAGQPDAVEELVDPLAIGPLAFQFEGKLDVLLERPPRQQIRILEDHRDLRMRPGDGLAVDRDPAAGQLIRPAIDQSKVVLPQPEGPMMQRNSPSRTSTETSSSA